MADKKDNGLLTVATNKKAYHEYFVNESFEAGIELFGTEVKSVRQGKINLKDAWCSIDNGEIYVNGMHISPYDHGNIFNRDPVRKRRLLMHKREINKLFAEVQQEGMTLIPLSAYFNRGRLKIQVGLCKGKHNYDKRATIAKRDADLEKRRAIKEFNH
ncbi:MAG: SsrA-binding protein SmpB [Oscillospiraceae bacterium]|nr:SsrA-binding protein SmpB [Candidatus Limimonas coprohippi]MCQ2488354.1 SsrA-binding protein SmpB [Clostridia bacterium]